MAAIIEGKYAMVAIPDPKLGAAQGGCCAPCSTWSDTGRVTPNKEGLPVFLTQAVMPA